MGLLLLVFGACFWAVFGKALFLKSAIVTIYWFLLLVYCQGQCLLPPLCLRAMRGETTRGLLGMVLSF